MRVKRASFVLFDLVDEQRVDLAALLRGEVDLTRGRPRSTRSRSSPAGGSG